VTATPVPEPFHVSLTLYNSAGEVVRRLYDGTSQVEPDHLETTTVSSSGPNGSLAIAVQVWGVASVNAPPPIVWNGTNDNGQVVANGTYYFKLDVEDPFGKTSSLVKEVPVVGNVGGNSLAIFNSAGEIVRNINLDSLPGGASFGRLTDFSIDNAAGNGTGATGADATGAVVGGVQLKLRNDQGVDFPWTWDGLNDQGAPVSSGSYTLRLVRQELGTPTVVKSESVILLQSPNEALQASLASAVVGPSPYRPSAGGPPPQIRFLAVMGFSTVARVYNLAGELVAVGVASSSDGRIDLNVGPLASGIYVIDLNFDEGRNTVGRRILKWALLK
jgi:flagellar hook assembly protein FlgD